MLLQCVQDDRDISVKHFCQSRIWEPAISKTIKDKKLHSVKLLSVFTLALVVKLHPVLMVKLHPVLTLILLKPTSKQKAISYLLSVV